jgi:hypothetical protein
MQDEKSGMFPDSEDPELACVDGSLIDSDWNAGAPPDEIAEESLVRSGGENGTEGNPGPDGPKADQSFKLKYLGRELDVSRTSDHAGSEGQGLRPHQNPRRYAAG